MPEQSVAWWTAFGFGAIAGSLLVGSLLGLIPLVLGQFLGLGRLGRVAFLVTVVSALVAGIFLAVPSALAFTITILVRWRRAKASIASSSNTGA